MPSYTTTEDGRTSPGDTLMRINYVYPVSYLKPLLPPNTVTTYDHTRAIMSFFGYHLKMNHPAKPFAKDAIVKKLVKSGMDYIVITETIDDGISISENGQGYA